MGYDAAENCPGAPTPSVGERSLHGPVYFHQSYGGWESEAPQWAKDAAAEDPSMPAGEYSGSENLKELRVVIAALRKTFGLRVVLFTAEQLRAEGAPDDETPESAERKALYKGGYLEITPTEPLVVTGYCGTPLVELKGFNGEHNKSYKDECAVTNRVHPWVHLKLLPACTRHTEAELISNLHKAGALVALLPHAEEAVNLTRIGARYKIEGAEYEMRVVHGEGDAEAKAHDPQRPWFRDNQYETGSLFRMIRVSNGKVVGKVLMAYHNAEMNSAGPTLEIIEVAEGWRQFGIGYQMMFAVEQFYLDLFGRSCCFSGVIMSACNVTGAKFGYASPWLIRRCHFEDADGWGEELVKNVVGAERDDALEYYDPQPGDWDFEDEGLLEEGPTPVYECRGLLLRNMCCGVELEWHGEGPMPKEMRFCGRCAQGKWDPRVQFPREVVLG